VLLQQDSFNQLLQSIKQPGVAGMCRKASTRVEYIRPVLYVLGLEEVQQLLSQQQLQALKLAAAEKQQANLALKADAAATGRAAAAAAAAGGGGGLAGSSKTNGSSGGGPFRTAFRDVSAGALRGICCLMVWSHKQSCNASAIHQSY
jgi:hypothetical protein